MFNRKLSGLAVEVPLEVSIDHLEYLNRTQHHFRPLIETIKNVCILMPDSGSNPCSLISHFIRPTHFLDESFEIFDRPRSHQFVLLWSWNSSHMTSPESKLPQPVRVSLNNKSPNTSISKLVKPSTYHRGLNRVYHYFSFGIREFWLKIVFSVCHNFAKTNKLLDFCLIILLLL